MTNDTIYAKFDDDGFVTGFWQSAAYEAPAKGEDRNPIIPADAAEITQAQFDELFEYQGRRKWFAGQVIVYDPPPPEPVVPDRVSRRLFRQQLLASGLLAQVEGWIATQNVETQMSYADAATFVRADEMLQRGFADLGFTVEQVDAFFYAAVKL